MREQFNFPETTIEDQNISDISAEDTHNKIENNDDQIIKTENGMIKFDQTIFSVS